MVSKTKPKNSRNKIKKNPTSKIISEKVAKQTLQNKDTESTETLVESPPEDEKLQKVLARVGLGSRREMEKVIAKGAIQVNDKIAKLGDRVGPEDIIEFDGKRIQHASKDSQDLRILLYNKPEGQICSKNDPEGRPTVFDQLPRLASGRWISVGRLDFNTSGLLLFTNNGELANALMHPSSNIDREYLVRIQGEVNEDMIKRLRNGVELDDGMAKFTDIKAGANEGSNAWFYCVVMEGRNREVRRLWESQDVRVSRLKRVRYGNIFIPSHVRVGQWIELEDAEIRDLHETAGLPAPKKSRYSAQKSKTKERHQRKLRASSSTGKVLKPKRVAPKLDTLNKPATGFKKETGHATKPSKKTFRKKPS